MRMAKNEKHRRKRKHNDIVNGEKWCKEKGRKKVKR